MALIGATSPGKSSSVVSPQEVGFNGLTADDFMKMMIAQLQHQDPLAPTGNEELLAQISQMRSLQSNIQLSDSLESLTSNQQLSTAAAFIGKAVSATVTVSGGTQGVAGVVDRAFLRSGKAYVGVGHHEVPLTDIHTVLEP